MALPSSGTISLLDIQNEFTNGGQNLLSYHRRDTAVSENQYNMNIPTSGGMNIRQFLGAARVDQQLFYSSASPWGNGSATWYVPYYAETCRVECYGSGAAGGGATYGVGWYGGVNGNPTFINDLGMWAGGGYGCAQGYSYTYAGGAGGTASGGDVNTSGGAAQGGSHYGTYYSQTGQGGSGAGPAGGRGGYGNTTTTDPNSPYNGYGEDGQWWGGGGGGAGDYYLGAHYWAAGGGGGSYCKKEYARGALSQGVGHTVNYAGIAVPLGQMHGGHGQLGIIVVTWW